MTTEAVVRYSVFTTVVLGNRSHSTSVTKSWLKTRFLVFNLLAVKSPNCLPKIYASLSTRISKENPIFNTGITIKRKATYQKTGIRIMVQRTVSRVSSLIFGTVTITGIDKIKINRSLFGDSWFLLNFTMCANLIVRSGCLQTLWTSVRDKQYQMVIKQEITVRN